MGQTCEDDFAWFDHLEERVSHKGVLFKNFCPPVKTSCPPVENGNETPELVNW